MWRALAEERDAIAKFYGDDAEEQEEAKEEPPPVDTWYYDLIVLQELYAEIRRLNALLEEANGRNNACRARNDQDVRVPAA